MRVRGGGDKEQIRGHQPPDDIIQENTCHPPPSPTPTTPTPLPPSHSFNLEIVCCINGVDVKIC